LDEVPTRLVRLVTSDVMFEALETAATAVDGMLILPIKPG